MLILAGRYGSIEPKSKKSYTQLEYEYAIEKSRPLFACAINEGAPEKKIKKLGSIASDNQPKLKTFRELVVSKTVRFWDDTKDIKIAVGESLSNFARRENLAGWVRSGQEANMPALADEIARLSKENAKLRDDLAGQSPVLNIHGLSFEELTTILKTEDVLDFFLAEKDKFASGTYADSPNKAEKLRLKKLYIYGLVKRSGKYFHGITDEGRVFLNKYAFTQIKNSEDEEDGK